MNPPVSDRLCLGIVFVLALAGAFAFGAWQGYHTPPNGPQIDAAAQSQSPATPQAAASSL